MKNWQLFEQILKKPLEEIVDLITGNWKNSLCKEKKKYFDKEILLKALQEKEVDKKNI